MIRYITLLLCSTLVMRSVCAPLNVLDEQARKTAAQQPYVASAK